MKDMLWEEPRSAPPEGKQWYSVPVEFVREAIYEVAANSEEEAKQLVLEQCHISSSETWSDLPKGHVVWTVDVLSEKRFGEIMLAEERDPM